MNLRVHVFFCHYSTGILIVVLVLSFYAMFLSLASYVYKFLMFLVNVIFGALMKSVLMPFWDEIQSLCPETEGLSIFVHLHYKPKFSLSFIERVALSCCEFC